MVVFFFGDGRLLAFFLDESREPRDIGDRVPGEVHHLAFRIDGNAIPAITNMLEEAGYPVNEFDRGTFHSLYTEDNSGLGIELVADKCAMPDARRGQVLALAHQFRIAAGADFVEGDHMRAAIRDLGLDVEEKAVGEVPSGRDV